MYSSRSCFFAVLVFVCLSAKSVIGSSFPESLEDIDIEGSAEECSHLHVPYTLEDKKQLLTNTTTNYTLLNVETSYDSVHQIGFITQAFQILANESLSRCLTLARLIEYEGYFPSLILATECSTACNTETVVLMNGNVTVSVLRRSTGMECNNEEDLWEPDLLIIPQCLVTFINES